METRVRFAPSPTGALHLGSARTALYNWLYARHHGEQGTYVLRIEDTDQERSTQAALDQALAVFEWLGLDEDEGPVRGGQYGPYIQTQRAEGYRAAAARLVEEGKAYECFCTPDELNAAREAAAAANRPLVYPGTCRDLGKEERAARRAEGREAAIRFRVPEQGATVVDDMIKGEATFENALLGDFIIQRTDGLPVYNFACVVDDAAMRITHVIRGDDHLSNTPRQVLLYEALGHDVPRFAHLPMILGPDRKKLSKRNADGAAYVEELAELGYIPEAVRNYLALLGWSKDDTTTVMSTAELVEAFDVARVNTSPAAIDYDKFRWINGQHLRALPAERWAELFAAWARDWMPAATPGAQAVRTLDAAVVASLVQEKVDVFSEVPAYVTFLAEPHEISDEAWERLRAAEFAPQVLEEAERALAALDSFDVTSVEGAVRGLCETLGQKPKFVFGPLRFAVTGQVVAPGLWESIAALGRERALERIAAARTRLGAVAHHH